ncbi:MAG TPA: branched-chain amino acid ABC transporter permease, partial [Gaiellaceae bacterium]|nr:branched-chain amino acid ABC transporter permease [Gaiellaceae bacterium]
MSAARRILPVATPIAVFGFLALIPTFAVDIPKVFDGPLDQPGTLQILALMVLFGGVAMTYDLLFGYTGLLSFGHALYFAIGVYLTAIGLTHWEWSLTKTLLVVAAVGFVAPLVLGAISLRVAGIAFAMVTLAFAQAGTVIVAKNPDGLTGAEEGVFLNVDPLPEFFIGVFNMKNLYWLTLGYAVAVFFIVRWVTESSPGRVWQAIRENELRVQVLGLRPFSYKLMAFVLASFLATAGGVVYMLLFSSTNPAVTAPNFTLSLLLMVVIGGAGSRWGAVLGGILYTYLDDRLAAVGSSSAVQDLPKVLRTPLEQPLFLLGVIFILIVFFLPGGIAGLASRGRP